jgi:hypothetical protein
MQNRDSIQTIASSVATAAAPNAANSFASGATAYPNAAAAVAVPISIENTNALNFVSLPILITCLFFCRVIAAVM